MTPDEIKANLTKEQWELYLVHQKHADGVSGVYHMLAERNRLLNQAKQYIEDEQSGMPFDEDQNRELEQRGKNIYVAIAAALKGRGSMTQRGGGATE